VTEFFGSVRCSAVLSVSASPCLPACFPDVVQRVVLLRGIFLLELQGMPISLVTDRADKLAEQGDLMLPVPGFLPGAQQGPGRPNRPGRQAGPSHPSASEIR